MTAPPRRESVPPYCFPVCRSITTAFTAPMVEVLNDVCPRFLSAVTTALTGKPDSLVTAPLAEVTDKKVLD